jgi:hypothetical protein
MGAWAGIMVEKSDDVHTRWSTASAGRANLTGKVHSAEREERGAQGNDSATGEPGPRDRERERACGRRNWRRQVGPTRQRAREGGRAKESAAADRRGPRVRQRGRAAWLGRAGLLSPFLFL